jgi:hypothetical protein
MDWKVVLMDWSALIVAIMAPVLAVLGALLARQLAAWLAARGMMVRVGNLESLADTAWRAAEAWAARQPVRPTGSAKMDLALQIAREVGGSEAGKAGVEALRAMIEARLHVNGEGSAANPS